MSTDFYLVFYPAKTTGKKKELVIKNTVNSLLMHLFTYLPAYSQTFVTSLVT